VVVGLTQSVSERPYFVFGDKKKVTGFMKFQGNEVVYTHFIGLRAEIYSMVNYDPVLSKTTVKGVKANFIKFHVKHDMYLNTLFDRKCTMLIY